MESFFTKYVMPVIEKLTKKYQAESVYCMGSFANSQSWQYGISDIDIVIFTQKKVFFKEDVLLGDSMNAKGSGGTVLTYVVWNIYDFLNQDKWKEFLYQKQFAQSSIIEDQLFFMAGHSIILGCKNKQLDYLTIPSHKYREYLICRYNNAKKMKPQITLVQEIKRIIYACRIYYFLWFDEYIYDREELMKKLQSVLDLELTEILFLACQFKDNLTEDKSILNYRNAYYFSETMKMYKRRIKLVEKLVEQDRTMCKEYVNSNFIEFY